jgi:hypothetical protein
VKEEKGKKEKREEEKCNSSPKGASRLTSLTKETVDEGAALREY